jgi:hypothetical protein
MSKCHSSTKAEIERKGYKKRGGCVVIQPRSQAEDARVTFVALYHFKYSLRHLLNRLINLRMIGVSESVREHGVHLAKGRPGVRAERPLGRTAGTAPVPLII